MMVLRIVILVTALLVPSIAWGQGTAKQCVAGKPTHCVQPLVSGEPAPFDGQLYTTELALDHSEKVHSFEARLKLDVEYVRIRLQLEIENLQRLREIDLEASNARGEAHKRALDAALPPFYERPAFVIPLTAIIVVGAILAVFAISAEYGQFLWTPER